eukprot:maker-scaffold18_size714446-snap-gene-6.29 protein:Tk08496 transcript:maker-scaffold18_size714446-snap-gene-6.29-mRNA-1 annotation:"fasciculation and elongation protein zeta-2"
MCAKKTPGSRTISKTKRNLQKRNKLIKRGKLKPRQSGTSTWLKNQQNQHEQNRRQKGRKGGHTPPTPEDEALYPSESDEEMELDQAQALRGQAGLAAHEAQARARYAHARQDRGQHKPLLPIKTPAGLVQQSQRLAEDVQSDEASEDEAAAPEVEAEDDLAPMTTLSLMANREMQLSELRLMLGQMATAFLQDPQGRTRLLDQLVATLSSPHAILKNVGWMLTVSTVVEVFNDVIPAYRIGQDDPDQSDVVLKKETLRLHKFEKSLLAAAHAFLLKVQGRVKSAKQRPDKVNLHTLKCLGTLVTRHPQFNYTPNIVQLIIPLLNSKHLDTRRLVRNTISTLLREDKRGDIALHVVKCVKKEVVRLKYHCSGDFMLAMLDLKLAEVVPKSDETPENGRKRSKKDAPTMSKKEKKRKKAMSKLDKELLEAQGAECQATRVKLLTEVTKILFHVLFTILKDDTSQILGPALRVISKFSHTISIDFLYDIVNNIARLVQNDEIDQAFRLQAIKTSLDLLSGNSGIVNYDTNVFLKPLSDILPHMDLNQTDIDYAEGVILQKGPETNSNILTLGTTQWELSLLKDHYDAQVGDAVVEWLNPLASMNSGELKVNVPLATVESDADDDLESNHSDTNPTASGISKSKKQSINAANKSRSSSANRRASPRFNLDGGDSVTGSLEDLVNSFDDKLTKVFHDYQEQVDKIAPVQVRSQEEIMNECQVWWTITGNFGNMMPIDWSKSTVRAKHLPTLNLNGGSGTAKSRVGRSSSASRAAKEASQDGEDLEEEDDIVAADLDMHSLILSSNPNESSEPIKSADEVIKEIDDMIEDDEFQDEDESTLSQSHNCPNGTRGSGAHHPREHPAGFSSYQRSSQMVSQALAGRKLEELSTNELTQILNDIEILVRDLSEELVSDLGIRDELEYEKELKNTFISLLLSIQSKRRQHAAEGGKMRRDPKDMYKYLTTVIPYQPERGEPPLATLQVLVKILKSINEDSPAVPALLTDYILKNASEKLLDHVNTLHDNLRLTVEESLVEKMYVEYTKLQRKAQPHIRTIRIAGDSLTSTSSSELNRTVPKLQTAF